MDTLTPKISIIIPNFNRGDLLSETLNSVLKQDYTHWEAIVVDDGSTDNSLEIGRGFEKKDSRISFVIRKTMATGAPVCRNIGLKNSSGDYIIFLDSDDLMTDFCLSQRVSTINKYPDNDFWVFPMWVFFNSPNQAKYLWNIESSKSDISRFLCLDAVWQTSGPVWKKSSLQKIDGFTENLACWQDIDIHLKALGRNLKYDKYYVLKPDIFYRQHKYGSISQNEISSLPKLRTRLDILIYHFSAIEPKENNILEAFKIMASNIAMGSARTLHKKITSEVLKFGKISHLFDQQFIIKVKLIQALTILRLSRISAINKFILRRVKKFQYDSNIGKHTHISLIK